MNFAVFGKNALIYAIGNACARTGAFLLIPLYTHSFSLADYGLLSTLLITIQLMTLVMSLGTHKGLMRFASECERRNGMGELIVSAMATTVVGAIVVTGASLVILLPVFRSLFRSNEVGNYVALSCGAALFQALFDHLTSYYRAKNEGIKFVVANLAVLMLVIATNFVLLRILKQGVKGALISQVVTYASLWFVVLIGLIGKEHLRFSLELTRRLFYYSFPLLFALVGHVVKESSMLYFLGYFGDLEQVAIYTLGQKIAQIAGVILILPFQLAYEPFVYGNIDNPQLKTVISKLLTYFMVGYAFVAFGIIFITRPLLSVVAPPSYFPAYEVVFWMLPGMAFIEVYYIAESLLGIGNKTYYIGGVVTLFAFISISLNYFLIPLWGLYGAILVFNLTLIFSGSILMIAGKKVFPIQLELMRLVIIGGVFLFFMLFVYLLRDAQACIYYSVIPAVTCGALALLYVSNFCDDREKAAIRTLLRTSGSRIFKQTRMTAWNR